MTEEEAAAVERPALSRGEWISTRTGVLRSQYTTAAVEQVRGGGGTNCRWRVGTCLHAYLSCVLCMQHVASLLSGLEGGSLPARTLQQLSEQCVPIMHLPRSKPVVIIIHNIHNYANCEHWICTYVLQVEALLQCTTTVPDGGGEGGRGLAEGFLERLTELEMSSEVTLSYEAQTTLWCTHLPSFKQEVYVYNYNIIIDQLTNCRLHMCFAVILI